MIKDIRAKKDGVMIKFVLDKPQPYKDLRFIDFPLEGTLEIINTKDGSKQKVNQKHIIIKNSREMTRLLNSTPA